MTPRDKEKADRLFEMLCETYQPESDYQEHLLRVRANAETLAERCQEIGFALLEADIRAAHVSWQTDQAIAAQQLASKLPKAPALVSLQLTKTPEGVAVLHDLWSRLGQALEKTGNLTVAQSNLLLDLLGTPLQFREPGELDLESPETDESRVLTRQIVERNLQDLRDPEMLAELQEWDDFCREMALAGSPVRITPEMRLMKRYESMHLRRAQQAMAEFLRLRAAVDEDLEETASSPTGPGSLRLQSEMHQAAERHWRQAASAAPTAAPTQPVKPAAPAAPQTTPTAPPAAPKPAAASKPSVFNWGGKSKPSKNTPPPRDREAERAKKKDERKARNKQQKNQRKKR
jgi:hypothetical protein